jgi:di/tricarboxylate transporter
MITHGLDRRFAFLVLSLPGVGRSTYGVIIAFGVIAASISAFISNTTTAAMLLPIGLGMMGALGGMVSDQSDTDRDVTQPASEVFSRPSGLLPTLSGSPLSRRRPTSGSPSSAGS